MIDQLTSTNKSEVGKYPYVSDPYHLTSSESYIIIRRSNLFKLKRSNSVLSPLLSCHVDVSQRKDTQSCVTGIKTSESQSGARKPSSVINTWRACRAESTPGCCLITFEECTFRCVFLFWNRDLPPVFCFIITQSCARLLEKFRECSAFSILFNVQDFRKVLMALLRFLKKTSL